MVRLFISIPVPEDIKKELKLLDGDVSNCKWTNTNNLHLTLKYIGEVNEQEYWKIKDLLREIEFHSFSMKVENIGYFEHRKNPKALWAGIPKSKELCTLKKMIEQTLTDEPIMKSPHHFRPHITIGRMKNARYEDVAKFIKKNSLFESHEFEVDEFQLMSSHQERNETHYQVEGVYHLDRLVA